MMIFRCLVLLVAYLACLSAGAFAGEADYLVAGRRLTLPGFVASLVTTWYGGILGVGEYTYRYGIANWFVFGLPYYVAAALFAHLLEQKILVRTFPKHPLTEAFLRISIGTPSNMERILQEIRTWLKG